jgi:hypothetical protein
VSAAYSRSSKPQLKKENRGSHGLSDVGDVAAFARGCRQRSTTGKGFVGQMPAQRKEGTLGNHVNREHREKLYLLFQI